MATANTPAKGLSSGGCVNDGNGACYGAHCGTGIKVICLKTQLRWILLLAKKIDWFEHVVILNTYMAVEVTSHPFLMDPSKTC